MFLEFINNKRFEKQCPLINMMRDLMNYLFYEERWIDYD
jgi:hypothetical protein